MTSAPHEAVATSVSSDSELSGLVVSKPNIDQSGELTTGSSPAAEAVFNTTELCEKILQSLSFRDLRRARHVNNQFRDVINGSKSLQDKQKLFTTVAHKPDPLLLHILRRCGFPLYQIFEFHRWGRQNTHGSRRPNFGWVGSPVLQLHVLDDPPAWPGPLPEYLADMLVSNESCKAGIRIRYVERGWARVFDGELLPGPEVRLRDLLEVLEKRRKMIEWVRQNE